MLGLAKPQPNLQNLAFLQFNGSNSRGTPPCLGDGESKPLFSVPRDAKEMLGRPFKKRPDNVTPISDLNQDYPPAGALALVMGQTGAGTHPLRRGFSCRASPKDLFRPVYLHFTGIMENRQPLSIGRSLDKIGGLIISYSQVVLYREE